MISFDTIANANWGSDVLTKDGSTKHNMPASRLLSFISCRLLCKHYEQKTEDVQPGAQAIQNALINAMKEIGGQKVELHESAVQKINELITTTNETSPADKKIALISYEALQVQSRPAPAPEPQVSAATSVLAVQSRPEEAAVAPAAQRQRSKRMSEVDRLLLQARSYRNYPA